MTKTMNLQSVSYKRLLSWGVMAAILFTALLGIQSAYAAITSQLDFGDRGEDVTELQTYLATNPNLYPSGLVTGYFGPLTQAGVQKFQTAQGIVSSGSPATTGYGRVGPQTMLRLNALMGGSPAPTFGDAPPFLSVPSIQLSNTSATFSWTTNEPTRGQVYYDTAPLRADEATGPRQLPYVSGTLAQNNGGMTSHSITITNLQANTTYYYLVRNIDSVGNMSMIWPSSFRTNP